MTFRIPKGKHRARPFWPWLWWSKKNFAWVVKFEENCRYDLRTNDQFDTNKLVGVGYLPGHHKESARFGWRFWTDRGEIELTAYCYLNGQRMIRHIGFCEINKWYRIELFISRWSYHFTLDTIDGNSIGHTEVKHTNTRKLQYRLGPYFGGNARAPRDMHIKIEKS